ncbi:lipid transferase CIDEC [Pogona vitticeps]
MDYAMKPLSFLSLQSVSRCVSVGNSSEARQPVLPPPHPHPRPYRVSNWDRTLRKGIMADNLRDLLQKVRAALLVGGMVTLALDEDGTIVDNEEFFQTLKEGTVFVALTKGQSWYPAKTPGYQLALSQKPRRCHDVVCVSLDLYKTKPEDFIGCLNFQATLYGTYSISYDMHCYGAKRLVKEAVRWVLYSMQATGHLLLGTSSYVQQVLDSTEAAGGRERSLGLRPRFGAFPSGKMLE